jgi:hypothetical protein
MGFGPSPAGAPAGAIGLGAIGFGADAAAAGFGSAAGDGLAGADDVVVIWMGSPSPRGGCGLIVPLVGGPMLRGSGFWSGIRSSVVVSREKLRAVD